MLKKLSLFLFLLITGLTALLAQLTPLTQAQAQTITQAQEASTSSQPHLTLFINQVRTDVCCDPGNYQFFADQIDFFEKQNLPVHFALRSDVLDNQQYITKINDSSAHFGLLLEITPPLLQAIGLEPRSTDQWYEAQNSMLIGYSPEERKQIIDHLFEKFKTELGYYPQFTSSWMIDAWSLQYLAQKYNVQLHQITREQFGTDSYTLQGGPAHQPYYPERNWALQPDLQNTDLPLIVRQTITDPVHNYGDRTNSHTSQPNDYLITRDSEAGWKYFEHLFNQAHQQPTAYTFALLGLENSMDQQFQTEYQRQIQYVREWAQEPKNQVVSWEELLATQQRYPTDLVSIYFGQDQEDSQEKAWWINTPTYRARLRLSNNELFISDLRLYDHQFTDPYLENPSQAAGWWIVPYVIDGARFTSNNLDLLTYPDDLRQRPTAWGNPHRISIAREVSDLNWQYQNNQLAIKNQDQNLVTFNPTTINFQTAIEEIKPFKQPIDTVLDKLSFYAQPNQPAWEMQIKDQTSTFFVNNLDLQKIRFQHKKLLFPEASQGQLDPQTTQLYINNRFAIAGRNPVRLVLFPKDQTGDPIQVNNWPRVELEPSAQNNVGSNVYQPHSSNGMFFIDLNSSVALTVRADINLENFSQPVTVIFAPNCTQNPVYCLTHPRGLYYFLRTKVSDKWRQIRDRNR